MAKFSHKTLFIPPPFIADKRGHHEKFLEMLAGILPKEGKISLALTRGYRSIAEITRYGDKEENRNVDAKGQLKPGGAKMILKFLRDGFGMETPIGESKCSNPHGGNRSEEPNQPQKLAAFYFPQSSQIRPALRGSRPNYRWQSYGYQRGNRENFRTQNGMYSHRGTTRQHDNYGNPGGGSHPPKRGRTLYKRCPVCKCMFTRGTVTHGHLNQHARQHDCRLTNKTQWLAVASKV
ncbi:hypothetical protein GPALN_003315 [Globodera pallida]|nr:hypothetical protein GPALN_003315 [Globodera pallida]